MNYDFEYTQNSKTKAADGAFTLPIEEKQTSDCILKVVDLSQLFSKYETYLKKPHTRDFHVIYWAERVKGKIELNGKLFELHDNSLIFLNEFQTVEFIDTEYISGKIFVFSEHLFYQIKAEALALIYADFF